MGGVQIFGSRTRRTTKIVRDWLPAGTDPVLAELAVTAASMVDGGKAVQDPKLVLQAMQELERLRGLIVAAWSGGDDDAGATEGSGLADWVGAGPEVRDRTDAV